MTRRIRSSALRMLATTLFAALGATSVATQGVVLVTGSDADTYHGLTEYAQDVLRELRGASSLSVLVLGDDDATTSFSTAVGGNGITTVDSLAGIDLDDFAAVYLLAESTGGPGCCIANVGLVVGYEGAIQAYLAGGGSFGVQGYTGDPGFDPILGTVGGAPAGVLGFGGSLGGPTAYDDETPTAEGLARGFASYPTVNYWGHQGFSMSTFGPLGFESLIDAPIYGAGVSGLMVKDLAAAVVTIDFDGFLGWTGGFAGGTPFGTDYLIDVEYAPLGVLFDSDGGGLALSSPSNFVSSPNTVAATEPGPVISYSVPATAEFWMGDRPAVADFVQVTLTNTTSPSSMEAYDFFGNLLGTSFGSASEMLRVDAPGAIHRVVIQQGPMAFDDFTFAGLTALSVLAVTPASPGRVGVPNELVITGAPARRPVFLQVVSGPAGPSAAPLQPLPVVALTTDAAGRASYSLELPAALSGTVLRARVLTPGGQASPWSSNVIAPATSTAAPALTPRQALPGAIPPR